MLRTKRSANAFTFGDFSGSRTVSTPVAASVSRKRLGKQRVPIMEEEAFADHEPIDGIGELTTALDDPGAVGLRGDPGDVDTARGELDHKQHHISASNPSG